MFWASEPGHRFKATLHATQLVRKETATVHHADHEPGVALESTAEEEVRDSDGALGRATHHVVEVVAGQVNTGERVTRVENDETTQALGRFPEGVETGPVEIGAVHGGSDLHTGHP